MKINFKIISIILAVIIGTTLFFLNISREDSSDLPLNQDETISLERQVLPDSQIDSGDDSPEEVVLTVAEVAKNNRVSSCWTIINENVYDITSYIPNHPGGEEAISSICGRDGTAQFERQPNHNSLADQNLQRLLLGPLQD